GVGKWRPAYSDPLRGRVVVIIPDNDPPGRRHTAEVAQALHGTAQSVRVLPLPGSAKDVSDWLAAEHTAADLQQLAAAAPVWTPPAADHAPEQATTGGGRTSMATKIVDLALAAGAELFHTPESDGYATVP